MQLRNEGSGHPASADEASLSYPGWRIVGACFVMAVFCWGFGFYGQGVFLAELQKIHGWPTSLISTATTVYYLFSAVLVMFVADVIARLGPRAVVLGGTTSFAISAALLAFITEPWQLYAAYGLMAFGWGSMSIAGIVTILGLWFDKKRGLAISLSLNGASFGGILVAPALAAASAHYGFAPSILVAVLIMLMLMVPIALLVIKRPADKKLAATVDHEAAILGKTRARALRDPAFWTVVGPFSLALLAQVGVLVHQIAFLEPRIGQTQAALAVAITTAMAVVGRLSLGAVIDRLDHRTTSAVSLMSQAAAVLAMLWLDGSAALLIACAVYGFSVGNLITLPSLIVQAEFPARDFAMLIGLTTSIIQFAYSCGPAVVGLLRDATGSYQASLLACVALMTLAAAGILIRVDPESGSD